MKLIIMSPEKEILNCEVSAVELPGAKGRFMVWQDHAPLMTLLQKGVVRYDAVGGKVREELPVEGGFAEVRNNVITVCAG